MDSGVGASAAIPVEVVVLGFRDREAVVEGVDSAAIDVEAFTECGVVQLLVLSCW